MTAGWGGGFKDWGELRAHLIDTYGDTPRPETEAVIIAAYETHPAALEHAAQSIAIDVTNGTIRSGWAVLRSRAGSITTPQANPTRATGLDRERHVDRAKQWIRAAGIHYDRAEEVMLALFGPTSEIKTAPLRNYAQVDIEGTGKTAHMTEPRGDTQLVDELLHLWAEERPTGLQLERDAIARAEAWKQAEILMRQKLAAARVGDDQPL